MTDYLNPGDVTVVNHWLVGYTGEHNCAGGTIEVSYAHEPGCGYEPLVNLAGMSPVERVAVVLDSTAALGTPEVLYRVNHGESVADATKRLRDEVMQTAADIVRVLDETRKAR